MKLHGKNPSLLDLFFVIGNNITAMTTAHTTKNTTNATTNTKLYSRTGNRPTIAGKYMHPPRQNVLRFLGTLCDHNVFSVVHKA